ncbi:hypothetical protein H4S06_006731 [Coemansia sp. BCRC 34490]|nr:hypothetical protein H4S06_006731 [Coemansia sp. BCRC 34490]
MDILKAVSESGRIDFKGQQLAGNLATALLSLSSVAAFCVGFSQQQLSACFYTYAVGVALTYLAVLLPWPVFRRTPMVWLTRSKGATAASSARQRPIDSPNDSRKTFVEDVSDDGDPY